MVVLSDALASSVAIRVKLEPCFWNPLKWEQINDYTNRYDTVRLAKLLYLNNNRTQTNP